MQKNLCRIALLFVSFAARMMFAQAGTADLTGEVADATGSVIAAAKVTATEVQSGLSSETTASASGVYVFTNLRPGLYNVNAEATGFQRLERTGITLVTGERTRLDLTLPVGNVTQSITVAGDAPLLQTETASITQSIDHTKVVQLPLNGRTFV